METRENHKKEIMLIKENLRRLKGSAQNNWGSIFPAFVLGIIFSLFLSSYMQIDALPIGSKRFLAFAVLVGATGFIGFFFLCSWLRTQLESLNNRERIYIVILSLVIGPVLFFTTTSQWREDNNYLRVFLPDHKFEITSLPSNKPEAIFLSWANTSFGNIPSEDIRYDSKDSFYWEGKPGEIINIIIGSKGNGQAIFSWNGKEEIISLNSEPGMETIFTRELRVPWYASRGAIFLTGAILFSTLALIFFTILWPKRFEWLEELEEKINPLVHSPIQKGECTIILGFTLFALCLRIFNLEALPPHLEEYNHLIAAKELMEGVPLESVYQRSLYIVTIPVKAFFSVFGVHVWVARLPGVLLNSLAIIPLYFLARKLNKPIAILSVTLFATSPWVIALSRTVREYAYYPFFFYFILFGLIHFLELFPRRFIVSDYRILLTKKKMALIFLLIFPIIFAVFFDPDSTFKAIIFFYIVFLFFLLTRFEFKNKSNTLFLITVIVIFALGGILIIQTISLADTERLLKGIAIKNPLKNDKTLVLLSQFFFNPPVQWYYNRITLIPTISLVLSFFWGYIIKRKNFIPFFFTILYLFSIISFISFFSFSYAPRFFLHIQLWYIILLAIGLYGLGLFITQSVQRKSTLVFLFMFAFFTTFNIQQVLLHTRSSQQPPITYAAHMGFEELQLYLTQNVNPSDVLMSKYYGRYALFIGFPEYSKIYVASFSIEALEENDSGWVVIDNTRYWLFEDILPLKSFRYKNKEIQFLGKYKDNHTFSNYLWHWSTIPPP